MKTDEQIRRHRDDLREALIEPCDCRGKHAEYCRMGAKIIIASIEVLNWVLGENDDYEVVVRRMRKC